MDDVNIKLLRSSATHYGSSAGTNNEHRLSATDNPLSITGVTVIPATGMKGVASKVIYTPDGRQLRAIQWSSNANPYD